MLRRTLTVHTASHPPQDAAAYCQGLEAGQLLADHERGAGTPFAVVGWSPLVAHRALEEQVQPLLAPHIQDGTPPALRLHMCTIILAPPGATHRLAVAPRDTHAMIAQARWHAPSHAPVPHLTDLPWPGNQMEGALQVVCYPPNDTKAVYGNERRPGQSSFDPFAADFNAFPLARGATPHACVLHPGDTLLVPRGWWVTTRQLTPGVLLRREWVSAGAHAAQFQAASAASAQAPAQPGRVAGVEVQPPASDEDSTADDTGQDIFVVRATHSAEFVIVTCVTDAQPCMRHLQRAAAHRSRGNDFFTAGRIREATEAYSNAIDLLTLHSQDEAQRIVLETLDVNDACGSDEEAARQLCACLANRAACWLRRKQWAKAMRDCNAVLRAGRPHDEVTIKALFRRAKAHEGMGDADSAQADFRRVLELQPHNSDAAEQLEMYKSVLHRIVVMSYGDEDMRRRQKGGI